MIDIKGFFNTEEAKVGAGVAGGIYISEFGAALLRGFIFKGQSTGNKWQDFFIGALLKGFVGAILYNVGKTNLFARYMAIGAWSSIFLDIMRLMLPEAQAMAARFGAMPLPVIPAQAAGGAPAKKK